MKRFCILLFAVLAVFALVSCQKVGENNETAAATTAIVTTAAPTSAETTTQALTTEAVTTAVVSTEPVIVSKFPLTYDPKIMDKKGEAYLGDLLPLYHACVDAIVGYEPSVSGFTSYEDFEKVWQVLWISFYPSPALLIQSFSDTESPYVFEGDTVTFHFKNADKASHDEAYNAFADVINEGLMLIGADDDDWMRLARLYRYAHTSMEYRQGGADVTMYDHIVGHAGVCIEYAEYYALLVRNAGFDAMICNETGLPEPLQHAWTLIEVDGQWYHFDPCWGSIFEFGMSTKTRLDSLRSLVPDMPREKFDAVVVLSGDSWFVASEEFPDCPANIPDSVKNNVIAVIENTPALPCVPDPLTEEGMILDIGLGEAIRIHCELPADTVLTREYLRTLTDLSIYENCPETLVGLEYLTALRDISGFRTHVSDVSVITKLPCLESFAFSSSLIKEIPDLSTMNHLRRLDLGDNLIEDLSPLLTAPYLENVAVNDNRITSVMSIKDADNIGRIALNGNPILDISCLSENKKLLDGFDYFDYDFKKAVEVEKKAKEIISDIIKDDMTDLEKEYAIYRYQIDHMEYAVMTGLMRPFAYDGLLKGKGVCLEYANTFCMLSKTAGLDVIVVSSDTHAWNMIRLDGIYYHVDVLWDEGNEIPSYFNVGTDYMMHTPDHAHDLARYPEAEDMPYTTYQYLLQ